jgi:hypothetical protein
LRPMLVGISYPGGSADPAITFQALIVSVVLAPATLTCRSETGFGKADDMRPDLARRCEGQHRLRAPVLQPMSTI